MAKHDWVISSIAYRAAICPTCRRQIQAKGRIYKTRYGWVCGSCRGDHDPNLFATDPNTDWADALHDEREEQRTERAEGLGRVTDHERRYGEKAPSRAEAERDR